MREALATGAIAGYPVVDVRVVVHDGKHHPVDSKEIAFVTAGRKAFLEAMRAARAVVLEPIAKMQITAPENAVGAITGDLSTRRGMVTGTDAANLGNMVVQAQVPLAEIAGYQARLHAMTAGQGTYSVSLSHYEIVPPNVQQQLVSEYKVQDED